MSVRRLNALLNVTGPLTRPCPGDGYSKDARQKAKHGSWPSGQSSKTLIPCNYPVFPSWSKDSGFPKSQNPTSALLWTVTMAPFPKSQPAASSKAAVPGKQTTIAAKCTSLSPSQKYPLVAWCPVLNILKLWILRSSGSWAAWKVLDPKARRASLPPQRWLSLRPSTNQEVKA